mmetsp:Transcript_82588/g.181554  ORF Transcript_82588/g.181554 Transcript_82588/m.181554 type:complete len:279 (+) Transcript_82588:71-907(+)|eukprot:CAMPEP_0206458578 /NCGR_PEP_ID=MMETSP0324_2-20121206/23655_1 /ASSEMBLY_ACC=CAM_ASM_000836 /TAXON_ID=2866 /ORGANISM="Crypthecodinium cohnii, Strain Seligo" /LENGTH=278 /DNA_ID=CAMNT_0053929947 /DNA_START=51 /DNA_END=887 /DNA_ORIENTATION=+
MAVARGSALQSMLRCCSRSTGSFRLVPAQRRSLVTATSPKSIKRFYQNASVVAAEGGNWRVTLDGKPVKTPRGTFLELPTEPLAKAVAAEWASQGEHLKPREMPMMTIGCTALDLIKPEKEACIDRMIPFLMMDTLCFEDDQENLAQVQAEEWGPVRKWFEERFGVKLNVGKGLMGPAHPDQTPITVTEQLLGRDEFELAAMAVTTETAKSFLVAAALLDKPQATAKDAFRWALLEEHWQIERWGLVEGEHDVSHEETLKWFAACQRYGKTGRMELEE